ncbi:MAG: glycosyl hydrolase [Sphingopyxis sp.]|nr:glycosyl hydrolase [Sphingopyxis sp.]
MEMKLSRRETLASMVAMAGAIGLGRDAVWAHEHNAGLHAAAKAKGMRFGSAVSAGNDQSGSFRNPQYAKLLQRDCGLLVAENEMKWQALRPGPDAFNFGPFDAIVAFAEKNALAIRGHTLLWHRPQWQPAWLEAYDFGATPVREAERLLTTHIRTVTDRYRGKILSYDVVNETVLEDSTLAQTALSRAIGGTETLVDLAFHTAREQLPDAELVYNDYMSWEPGNEKHRAGVLKLLEGFKKRNVPVDALGVQSHIRIDTYDPSTGTGPKQEREWRQFIDEVTAMGYHLLMTEFDVNDQALPADIASRDQSVAAYAKGYLDLMFSYPQLKDVLAWGLCDSYSWLQQFQPTRTDGQPKRPCPYDSEFKPKPLHTVLAQAFASAPAR